jgi:quercetin dioxygenase-like cupin family protein
MKTKTFAIVSACIFVAAVALAQTAAKPPLHSSVFNWSGMKAEPTKVGERRGVFDAPTATLDRLECHITTLNPGESPHPAHRHPEEELMIVKEGTIEEVLNGVTNRVEVGGIIFCASNELHGMKNIGTNRATYFVFKIYPHGLNTNRLDEVVTPAK